MKFAHIINPVLVPPSSDLYEAQPITFSSLRRARAQVSGGDSSVEVDLLVSCYPEDRPLVPDDFRLLPPLQRSVLDCGQFEHPRKLPLIADILAQAHAASDADYLIYTNADIGLVPHFYQSVAALIAAGSDALVINRRTLAKGYDSPHQLMLIVAEAGQPHPGYDCFVFRRDLVPALRLREVCIGATAVGLVLVANLIKRVPSFRLCQQLHLTFHLGDDQVWRSDRYDDYRRHNEALALEILTGLERDFGPFRQSDPGWGYDALQRLRKTSSPPATEQPNPLPTPETPTATTATPPLAAWPRSSEPHRPSPQALAKVERAANGIRVENPAQRGWIADYLRNERTRLAFDLDLVLAHTAAGGHGLVFGAVPPILQACLLLAGYRVVAIDPAPGRLGLVSTESPLEVIECDPDHQALPFADRALDFIVYDGLIETLAHNPPATISEAQRVLKPGGRLFLGAANPFARHRLMRTIGGLPARPELYDDYALAASPGHKPHVRDFHPADAARLLGRCGLRVEQMVGRGRYPRRPVNPLTRPWPGLRPAYTIIASKPAATPPGSG